MNLSYSKATKKDYPQIASIEKNTFIRDFDFALDTKEKVERELGDCEIELIYSDKTAVGYIAIKKIDRNEYEIVGIAIIPKFQRKRIGSNAFKRIFKRIGEHRIKIVTHPKNIAAINFYYKFDFVIVGYKDEYYGKGQPRLILYRELQG